MVSHSNLLDLSVVDSFCVYCKQADLEKVQRMVNQHLNANLVNALNSNGMRNAAIFLLLVNLFIC